MLQIRLFEKSHLRIKMSLRIGRNVLLCIYLIADYLEYQVMCRRISFDTKTCTVSGAYIVMVSLKLMVAKFLAGFFSLFSPGFELQDFRIIKVGILTFFTIRISYVSGYASPTIQISGRQNFRSSRTLMKHSKGLRNPCAVI